MSDEYRIVDDGGRGHGPDRGAHRSASDQDPWVLEGVKRVMDLERRLTKDFTEKGVKEVCDDMRIDLLGSNRTHFERLRAKSEPRLYGIPLTKPGLDDMEQLAGRAVHETMDRVEAACLALYGVEAYGATCDTHTVEMESLLADRGYRAFIESRDARTKGVLGSEARTDTAMAHIMAMILAVAEYYSGLAEIDARLIALADMTAKEESDDTDDP